MRIIADQARCIGAAMCAFIEPGIFDNDARGLVVLRTEHLDGTQIDEAREAVAECPSGALSLVEEEQ